MKKKLYVVFSLDVEEEGLFCGQYRQCGVTLKNIPFLKKLIPCSEAYNLPLTLFCAYPVFKDEKAKDIILELRDLHGAEIAAHLHHWSTPPYIEREINAIPERTYNMDQGLLEEKLGALLQAGAEVNGKPVVSFRMGRWDLKSSLLPLLAKMGILTDSSLAPLRASGPDHFLAPRSPYWVEWRGGRILEAPITQVSVIGPLARVWYGLFKHKHKILDKYHFFGAVSPNPLWHRPSFMRLATRLQLLYGESVLSFFLHSSELMPGCSPHIRTEQDAQKLIETISNFCAWLRENFDVEGTTAGQLPGLSPLLGFPAYALAPDRDW